MNFRVSTEDVRLFEGVLAAEGITSPKSNAGSVIQESLFEMHSQCNWASSGSERSDYKFRPSPIPDFDPLPVKLTQLMGIGPEDDLALKAAEKYAANDRKMPGVHKVPSKGRKEVMAEKIHAARAAMVALERRKSRTAP